MNVRTVSLIAAVALMGAAGAVLWLRSIRAP
jgi:hypothetical protein